MFKREWFQKRLEPNLGNLNFNSDEQKYILQRLSSAEGLAKYLTSRYPGMKRFGIFKDGSKYTGNWLDNNPDGQGIYIYPDGSKEVGEFKNGLLNGFGIRYNADGAITQEGIFKDDEFLHAKTSEKKEPSKLDKYKSTCEELGFTPGTEKFGDCVIKLMD